MSKEREPEYLGDGVYATFDGYHIWLKTGAHEGPHVTNRIALEPGVWNALLRYHERLVKLAQNPEPAPESDDEAAARADHEHDQAKDDRLTGDR